MNTNEPKKYNVTVYYIAYTETTVDANDPDEARDMAVAEIQNDPLNNFYSFSDADVQEVND